MIPCEKEERQEISLLAGFGYRHDFQQVAIRILEIKTAAAPACVDPAVRGIVRSVAVGHALRFDSREDAIVIRVADVESVVVTLLGCRIIAGVSPAFGFIRKSQREAVIHLHAREETMAD